MAGYGINTREFMRIWVVPICRCQSMHGCGCREERLTVWIPALEMRACLCQVVIITSDNLLVQRNVSWIAATVDYLFEHLLTRCFCSSISIT